MLTLHPSAHQPIEPNAVQNYRPMVMDDGYEHDYKQYFDACENEELVKEEPNEEMHHFFTCRECNRQLMRVCTQH